MAARLSGKVALVTGGAKGIGAGIARALAAEGSDVVINYLRDAAGAETIVAMIAALGRRAIAVQGDIADPADVSRLFAEASATFGAIDVVVNNASLFSFAPLADITDEQIRTMLGANLAGTLFVCREAVKHFSEAGGAIINIGSVSSTSYAPGAAVYAASKAGVTAVTGVLAIELADRNIRVNQIDPGATDTEGARAIGAMTEQAMAAYIQRTPLGRIGTPADIADVAVFLASGAARWITGETIRVSGGLR